MNYFIKHFSYTLVLVASLLFSSVSFSEETKPQFVKDYESGYGKYFQVRSEAREKISLRSIASDDPNAPIKKDEAMNGFKKYLALQKEKQKRRENFDLDKDGKIDCKRKFYPNSNQIKTEVCDFDHDGVVDLKTKYNRDGLAVLELTNFDKDKFFEKKVSCKTITPDREVAKCVTETALGLSNTRTLKSIDYMSDFNQALKNRRKKRAGRSVASVSGKKDRFDDSKLKASDDFSPAALLHVENFEEIIKNNPKEEPIFRLALNEITEKKKAFEKLKSNNWKETDEQGNVKDVSFMRYFMGLPEYYVGKYDSCLYAARDCCQTDVDYEAMGAKGDLGDYQHCLNYSHGWCSANGRNLSESTNWCDSSKPKTEAEFKPCFECMSKDIYTDLENELEPYYSQLEEEFSAETPPKGFFASELDQIWYHESCRDLFDEEPLIETGDSCYRTKDGGTSVQATINRLKLARHLRPKDYSFFAKIYNKKNGQKVLSESEALDYWKIDKSKLIKICEETNDCQGGYVYEETPKLKVFCFDIKGSADASSDLSGLPLKFTAGSSPIYQPPYIFLDREIGNVRAKDKKTFTKIAGEMIMGHAIHHASGSVHSQPKKLKNGKYRCGWVAEPDYTALCSPDTCLKDAEIGGIWCGMRPGDHLTPEGDLTEEYMEIVFNTYYRIEGRTWGDSFGLVDDPRLCGDNNQ